MDEKLVREKERVDDLQNGYYVIQDPDKFCFGDAYKRQVDDIVYIQRGYENFEEKLRALGAEIERVSSEKEIQKFRLRVG